MCIFVEAEGRQDSEEWREGEDLDKRRHPTSYFGNPARRKQISESAIGLLALAGKV